MIMHKVELQAVLGAYREKGGVFTTFIDLSLIDECCDAEVNVTVEKDGKDVVEKRTLAALIRHHGGHSNVGAERYRHVSVWYVTGKATTWVKKIEAAKLARRAAQAPSE